MSSPLVSVIIPVYNGKHHLTEAIESVLQSTYQAFEIILVNDGSTDESESLCKELASKHKQIHFHSFEKNQGLSATLNFAISKAHGAYIARLNQDDLMLPDRLKHQVDFLESHKDYVGVGGYTEWFSGDKTVDIVKFPTSDSDIRKQWMYFSPFADPASTYRKESFDQTDGYQQRFWPVDDVHMWYQLGKLGKLANIPHVVTKVRWHHTAGSITSHRLQMKRLFELHRWATTHVEPGNPILWAFWSSQLVAGYILPPQLNWAVYRLLRKLKSV